MKQGPIPGSRPVLCRKLFCITFLQSACTFGGGFVIISMMKKKFVEDLGWLTENEMLDLTALAQTSPGALGVNIAIATGYRMCGLWGALACTLGAILPPLLIISLISLCYNAFRDNAIIALALKVMRAGVAAVICDVVYTLASNVVRTKSILLILLMFACFIAAFFFHVSSVVLILVCGLCGLFLTERKFS